DERQIGHQEPQGELAPSLPQAGIAQQAEPQQAQALEPQHPTHRARHLHGCLPKWESSLPQRLGWAVGWNWRGRAGQSAVAPESRTTLPHLAVSALMKASKAAGVSGWAMAPCSFICATTSGLASTFTMA